MDTTTPESTREQERMHHGGARRYVLIWVALVMLTVTTYLVSRIHFPPYHLLAALIIASAKSALVVLFFMHLYDHGGANRVVFVTSVFFVMLLIGLVVLDNATRFPLLNPGRGETLQYEPPGPDILSPRYPPEPAHRVDTPSAQQEGKDVPIPPLPPKAR